MLSRLSFEPQEFFVFWFHTASVLSHTRSAESLFTETRFSVYSRKNIATRSVVTTDAVT